MPEGVHCGFELVHRLSCVAVRRKKNHGDYCIADFIHVVGSA
jgi:hypothetical protein